MKAYDQDVDGRWWVTVWEPQCSETLLFGARCQGARGHAGDHWRYREDGTYEWAREGTGGGWTPPGHKAWVCPEDKAPEHYMRFRTTTEVTDPDIIKRLESYDEDIAGMISTPCSDEDVEELRRMGRLDEGPES